MGVGGGDGVERRADGGFQGRAGVRPGAAEHGLELAEGLLDQGEVGRGGRQEEEPTARALDERPHRVALVGAEVVEHHDLAGAQGRHQHRADVGLEGQRVSRPVEGQRGGQPARGQRGQEGEVLPAPVGDRPAF